MYKSDSYALSLYQGNGRQSEPRPSVNMHLRHTAVAHIRTSFSHFPLSERLKGFLSHSKGRSESKATHPAILSSLICNETDNNKRNNRYTSEDT